MKKNDAINKLCWIIIEAASKGYVPSNDLDFANECLDKLQGNLTMRAADETVCARCGDSLQKHQAVFHDHSFQAPFRR